VPILEAVLLGRTCLARGILFHGPRQIPALGVCLRTFKASLASRANTMKMLVTVVKAHLSGRPVERVALQPRILFLSHAAFWRDGKELYFDRLLPEVQADPSLEAFVLGVGPKAPFRDRGLWDAAREWLRLRPKPAPYVPLSRYTRLDVFREAWRATREIRALWRRLARSSAVREGFSHREVSFADLSGPDLAGTLLLQLPWAVRSHEELTAALSAIQPAALCLYAESSGLGRVALAASRAAGVPSVAIQHGILYPKYYSYRHEADEAGCPLPDLTALFGEAAKQFLIERGRYPPGTLVLTGSPKFDEIARTIREWDRVSLRRRLGVAPEERLIVVASRFRGIASYQSIGSAFAALVRAVEAPGNVRCIVKPHPAESPDAYLAVLRETGSSRTRLAPTDMSLLEMLYAGDALVTVESLSAVEALAVGRPVLLLNMPSNMRELVDEGVALGVSEGEDPGPALRALLFDAPTQARLASARERYLSRVACGIDGRATERLLKLLRETANGRGPGPRAART
jgi:glycosyltransferase involved in cell wall biosynthesis